MTNGIRLKSGRFVNEEERDQVGHAIEALFESLTMTRSEMAESLIGLALHLMKGHLHWPPSQARLVCDGIIGAVYGERN